MPLDSLPALPPPKPVIEAPGPAADRIQLARPLVQEFEGLRTTAYHCGADRAGVYTIGYGLLDIDLREAAADVARLVRVPISEGMAAALISFCFNLGGGALEGSTLLRRLNERRFEAAAKEFGNWIYADGKALDGLRRRRTAERQLYLMSLPLPTRPTVPPTQTAQAKP
jgi:lysozyme